MEIPWQEVYKTENYKREAELCSLAEDMINSFCENYGFTGNRPQLLTSDTDKRRAFCRSNGDIVISIGFLQWFDTVFAKFPQKFTQFVGKNSAAKIMMLWIVAHEFIHIARAHHQFQGKQENWEDALEYDADLFAIGGIFRHAHHICISNNASILPLNTKCFVLSCVFFYLRELIETQEVDLTKDHKPFYIRLWLIIEKLAWIDNFDRQTSMPTSSFIPEFDMFMKLIIESERVYLQYKGITHSKLAKLYNEPKESIYPHVDPIREKWKALELLILEKQLLMKPESVPGNN